jgi:hypothetical protein
VPPQPLEISNEYPQVPHPIFDRFAKAKFAPPKMPRTCNSAYLFSCFVGVALMLGMHYTFIAKTYPITGPNV